jgi:hypothetical protein
MKGDFSRFSFNRGKFYRKVNMQQGRVLLDSDWNEQNEISQYIQQRIVKDIVGQHAAPTSCAGFEITPYKNEFTIGPGHYYVDGILCENESEVSAANQPNMPRVRRLKSLAVPSRSGTYFVYLDVWERHVTGLQDSGILDPSLGGADTSTRTKIIWQVKTQAVKSVDSKIDRCLTFKAPERISTGKMRALTGYSGLESRLYRVEIHDAGSTMEGEKPTFKWSGENGSITAKISKITDGSLLLNQNQKTVDFETCDWVEVTDDFHELNGRPGTFVNIIKHDGHVVKFDNQNVIGEPVIEDNYLDTHNPLIRRWGSAPIEISSPCNEEDYIELDDGVKIQFSEGIYRIGDYWLMPCRPSVGLMWKEKCGEPSFVEAFGVEHHYCPLAIISKKRNGVKVVSDCRRFFQSLSELYHFKRGSDTC